MAKKAKLLQKAQELGLEVTEKNTIAELEAVIAKSEGSKPETEEEPKLAKAGKRSKKGIEEAEEKQAKIEHQKHASDEEEQEAKPKKAVKPARSRLERRSKNYRESAKLIEKDKAYELAEALELAVKTSKVKFDASVELHVGLNVDPKHADQNIRGTVSLPAGTGKDVRVAVLADVDEAKKAKAAGADIAGDDDLLAQIEKENINFDVLIAPPTMMAKLGKYARVLGPKGLMPNPKSGTVTTNLEKAVKEAKAGKVEYRVDSNGIIHLSIGKVSFKAEDLTKNAETVLAAIKAAKPGSVKGTYARSIFVTTTMGPSIKVVNAL